MVPKVTKSAPNVAAVYHCSVCGELLRETKLFTREPSGWKFCPICGEPIEWDKAKKPQTKAE